MVARTNSSDRMTHSGATFEPAHDRFWFDVSRRCDAERNATIWSIVRMIPPFFPPGPLSSIQCSLHHSSRIVKLTKHTIYTLWTAPSYGGSTSSSSHRSRSVESNLSSSQSRFIAQKFLSVKVIHLFITRT